MQYFAKEEQCTSSTWCTAGTLCVRKQRNHDRRANTTQVALLEKSQSLRSAAPAQPERYSHVCARKRAPWSSHTRTKITATSSVAAQLDAPTSGQNDLKRSTITYWLDFQVSTGYAPLLHELDTTITVTEQILR